MGLGKAPDQGGHVLHRVEPGGNAGDDAGVVRLQAHRAQIGLPVHGRMAGGEIQAVVDGKEPVRIKAAGDEEIGHRVGDADAVIQQAQGHRIGGPVDQPGGRAA